MLCLIRPETRHGTPNSNFSKLSRASKVQMIWNTAPSVIPNTQVVCSWLTEVLKGSLPSASSQVPGFLFFMNQTHLDRAL